MLYNMLHVCMSIRMRDMCDMWFGAHIISHNSNVMFPFAGTLANTHQSREICILCMGFTQFHAAGQEWKIMRADKRYFSDFIAE